eukprot:GHVU01231793.1.p1 GENE.GHVU01231793.1~~GHVU01231793.1.p1  ORF type:complete len:293 (-),score=38.11 GHVU01231793.1:54-932(-)
MAGLAGPLVGSPVAGESRGSLLPTAGETTGRPDEASLTTAFAELMQREQLEPSEAQTALVATLQTLQDSLHALHAHGKLGQPIAPECGSVPHSLFGVSSASSSTGGGQGGSSSSSEATSAEEDRLASRLKGAGRRGSGGGLVGSLLSALKSVGEAALAGMSPGATALHAADEDASNGGEAAATVSPLLRGLYIYGGVGQGKSMIADTFYATTRVSLKARVHFHEFMLDVQRRLHALKTEKRATGDSLVEVARQLRSEMQLIVFDEFQVVHIADAMILKRLFEALLHVRTRRG